MSVVSILAAMEAMTMLAAVPIREDFTVAELRALASRSRDARQCARLLALAGVAEGRSRLEAARLGGMDR